MALLITTFQPDNGLYVKVCLYGGYTGISDDLVNHKRTFAQYNDQGHTHNSQSIKIRGKTIAAELENHEPFL